MKEFVVRVTKTVIYSAKITIQADNADDAEDLATDEFFRDDGKPDGIRSKLQFEGHTVDFNVETLKERTNA